MDTEALTPIQIAERIRRKKKEECDCLEQDICPDCGKTVTKKERWHTASQDWFEYLVKCECGLIGIYIPEDPSFKRAILKTHTP